MLDRDIFGLTYSYEVGGGILDSPCPSVCPSLRLSVDDMVSGASAKFALEFQFQIHMHVDGGHRQKPINFQRLNFQSGRLAAILFFFRFPDSNFPLALNINFKLQRHNTYVYG